MKAAARWRGDALLWLQMSREERALLLSLDATTTLER